MELFKGDTRSSDYYSSFDLTKLVLEFEAIRLWVQGFSVYVKR